MKRLLLVICFIILQNNLSSQVENERPRATKNNIEIKAISGCYVRWEYPKYGYTITDYVLSPHPEINKDEFPFFMDNPRTAFNFSLIDTMWLRKLSLEDFKNDLYNPDILETFSFYLSSIVGFTQIWGALINADPYTAAEKKNSVIDTLIAINLRYKQEFIKYKDTVFSLETQEFDLPESNYIFDAQIMPLNVDMLSVPMLDDFLERQGFYFSSYNPLNKSQLLVPIERNLVKEYFSHFGSNVGSRTGKYKLVYYLKPLERKQAIGRSISITRPQLVKVDVVFAGPLTLCSHLTNFSAQRPPQVKTEKKEVIRPPNEQDVITTKSDTMRRSIIITTNDVIEAGKIKDTGKILPYGNGIRWENKTNIPVWGTIGEKGASDYLEYCFNESKSGIFLITPQSQKSLLLHNRGNGSVNFSLSQLHNSKVWLLIIK